MNSTLLKSRTTRFFVLVTLPLTIFFGLPSIGRAEGAGQSGFRVPETPGMPKIVPQFLDVPSTAADSQSIRMIAAAKGDFTGDGIPDLVLARTRGNSWEIALLPGNSPAIFPNEPGDRTTPSGIPDPGSPFGPPSVTASVSFTPDILETGDFNADGRLDLLAAKTGKGSLVMLPGNGDGSFAPARRLDLEGTVTALIAGDLGRRDGLDDFAVGIRSGDGPRLLLFSSPSGAWRSSPRMIELSDEATALDRGDLDGDGTIDLAAVAGNHLILLTGLRHETALVVDTVDLPFEIESALVTGSTNLGRRATALFVVERNGNLWSIPQSAISGRERTVDFGTDTPDAMISASLRPSAVPARLGYGSTENLLFLDPSGASLELVALGGGVPEGYRPEKPPRVSRAIDGLGVSPQPSVTGPSNSPPPPIRIDLPGKPVAVLPMRLGPDAFDDLVVLIEDDPRPLILETVEQETVVVDSTTDVVDGDTTSISALNADPGTDGVISLREAITAANNTVGLDAISFDIPVDTDPGCDAATGTCTIRPDGAEFPWISSPVTIDGTTQSTYAGTPVIEIDGSIVAAEATGLAVWAGGSTIRGLVFNRFADNSALLLWTNGGDIVENCFFGTDPSGTVSRGGYNAVHIYGISANTFGGTAAAAGNLVSGGDIGVALNGGTTDTTIAGNLFGTDVSGVNPLGNSGNSILITGASPLNTVGGSDAGAANVVADGIDGATMVTVASGSTGNLIGNNRIGTDLGGTIDLGGSGTALLVFEASGNTFGGTDTLGNVIAHNESGVYLVGNDASGNRITGNSIFDHTDLGIDLCGSYSTVDQGGTTIIRCDDSTNVTPNDTGDPDSGANDLQNFPVLTSIERDATTTTIGGTLDSLPDSTFTIELYSNWVCNPSVHGEGEIPLGTADVTTDATGTATFSIEISRVVGSDQFVTATATDGAGSTSEFSRCLVDGVDLEISMTAEPDPVQSGAGLSYNIRVENFGLTAATGVTVTDTLPSEATLISSTPACTVDSGVAVCPLGDLASGTGADLTLEILVDGGAVGPLVDTAVVSCDQEDPVTVNDTAETTTLVHLFADGFETGDTSAWSSTSP